MPPHLFKAAFEMKQAEAHTSLDCAKRYLAAASAFRVCPALKISQLDYHTLFSRDMHQCCSHLGAFARNASLPPTHQEQLRARLIPPLPT